ncbi:hypothetical protein J53TS2_05760 [Paenibacillus sp. J53TS2]|nr:hypothetical protein J53TS2_05760 [Paenibacillus sp. J53TS2]
MRKPYLGREIRIAWTQLTNPGTEKLKRVMYMKYRVEVEISGDFGRMSMKFHIELCSRKTVVRILYEISNRKWASAENWI